MAPSVDVVCARLLAEARPTPVTFVEAADAVGRVVAYPLRALHPLPAFDASVMDGYAVRAADVVVGAALPVAGESAAGRPFRGRLATERAARISTGAAVPAGADAVIPQEWTSPAGSAIRVDRVAPSFGPGTFVRPAGSDVRAGAVLLRAGDTVGPGEAALAAAAGHVRLPVRARPIVEILCTGDEIHPPGRRPPPGGIVGTNDLMLAAQVREAGGQPRILPVVPDDDGALAQALAGVQRRNPHVLVTSGGISVGPHDRVRPALEALGARCLFHGIALRPGRPTAAFTWGPTVVCALPGNPASTFVTFELLVRPLLRAMLGAPPHRAPASVPLACSVVPEATREHVMRARWSGDGRRAVPLAHQASGDLSSIAGATLLLRVPADCDRRPIPPGTPLRAIHLPERWT